MSETADRGKWSNPGIPHKGWVCLDVEDLEAPDEVCQMCEVAVIRYVHTMAHPNYPERLRCGCICAEHMSEDYVGPQLRERALRNETGRRKTRLARILELDEKIASRRAALAEAERKLAATGDDLAKARLDLSAVRSRVGELELRFKEFKEAAEWIEAGQKILLLPELTYKEREFVYDMIWRFERDRRFEPTARQQSWFVTLCRRMMKTPAAEVVGLAPGPAAG